MKTCVVTESTSLTSCDTCSQEFLLKLVLRIAIDRPGKGDSDTSKEASSMYNDHRIIE